MKICTLLLLLDGDQVLLAMKKRGFGAGYWNGAGGKLMEGESIVEALVRECQEEINVTPKEYSKVAELDFKFPNGISDMCVHAYTCTDWEGEPSESDEMAPQWFKLKDIPYAQMWQDDPHWLPLVLKGKKVSGTFEFDAENNMLSNAVTEVRSFA